MTRRWLATVLRLLVLVAAGVLLTSHGGQVIGAPVIVPGLYFAARSSGSKSYRSLAALAVALTTAEIAWFGAFIWLKDGQATLLWALPLATGSLTLAIFVGLIRPRSQPRAAAPRPGLPL